MTQSEVGKLDQKQIEKLLTDFKVFCESNYINMKISDYSIQSFLKLNKTINTENSCEHKETVYININKAGRYTKCIKCGELLPNKI